MGEYMGTNCSFAVQVAHQKRPNISQQNV